MVVNSMVHSLAQQSELHHKEARFAMAKVEEAEQRTVAAQVKLSKARSLTHKLENDARAQDLIEHMMKEADELKKTLKECEAAFDEEIENARKAVVAEYQGLTTFRELRMEIGTGALIGRASSFAGG
ncbi:PREDICTED: uncharacterized protein LOC104590335 [Nelumbo nucifera]|uniref:Uncharacterized protein LOC104590335 n=1 Tax=Nelumbo nucifera TaxID=4432 RepID=A0A1U7Z2B9_NELNU|nr:PREDICTED: uncharacterized protein LOC104590335 [Nelumbo nucifera]